MVSEAYFKISSKNLKRHWEYFKHNGNSVGLFKVFPYTVCVHVFSAGMKLIQFVSR